MSAAKFIAMMGRGSPRFIGAAGGLQGATGNIAIPYPAGTRAGDFAFVFLNNNSSPGTLSTSGWSSLAPSAVGGSLFWKRLVADDLTATGTVTAASNNFYTLVFRGYVAASNRTNQGVASNNGTSSKSWTGFTKGTDPRAILLFLIGDTSTTMTVTSPFMANATYDPAAGNSTGQYKVRILYNLVPAQYVDGTAVAETYGSVWNQVALIAFALT